MTHREAMEIRDALDGFVSGAAEDAAAINAHTAAIRAWKPAAYLLGDVRTHGGIPYRCVQVHDSRDNPTWTPDSTPALWMQYHGTTKESARPWIAPTGAQDMYKAGEYMIWTDSRIMKCLTDTGYSPDAYPQAWEEVG